MAREVSYVFWARHGPSPWPSTKKRPRGAKGLGVAYERKLAKALPMARHGLWFQFEDSKGRGWCQPDFVFEGPDEVLIAECKLQNYAEACAQLANLYLPVVARCYARRARGLVVVKYLSLDSPKELVRGTLREALALPARPFPILHWIGRGPIL